MKRARYTLVGSALAIAGGCLLLLGGCSSDSGGPNEPQPRVPVTAQYTDGLKFVGNPSYSPDGAWILFESDTGANRDIWKMPAADGDPVQLTTDPAFDTAPCWSADGSLVYFESDRSGVKKLWSIVSDASAAAARVTASGDDVEEGSPACSINGDLAYEYNSVSTSYSNLFILRANSNTPQALTSHSSPITNRTPAWSPGGAQLAFESTASGGSAVWLINDDGTGLTQLTETGYYEGHPAWSPDGTEIAYESRKSGYMELYVVPIAGGTALQITVNGGYWPEYSPDGSQLVYCVFGANSPEMWVMDVDWE